MRELNPKSTEKLSGSYIEIIKNNKVSAGFCSKIAGFCSITIKSSDAGADLGLLRGGIFFRSTKLIFRALTKQKKTNSKKRENVHFFFFDLKNCFLKPLTIVKSEWNK